MTKSVWTPDAVETLKDLWAGGATGGQIAEIMGMDLTRCAVLGKLHRMANYKLPNYARPPGRHKDPLKPGRPPGVSSKRPGPKEPQKPTLPVVMKHRLACAEHRLAAAPLLHYENPTGNFSSKPLGVQAILMERHPIGCAWPTDRDPGTRMWLHCNCHRVEGRDYCPDHLGLMYGR